MKYLSYLNYFRINEHILLLSLDVKILLRSSLKCIYILYNLQIHEIFQRIIPYYNKFLLIKLLKMFKTFKQFFYNSMYIY